MSFFYFCKKRMLYFDILLYDVFKFVWRQLSHVFLCVWLRLYAFFVFEEMIKLIFVFINLKNERRINNERNKRQSN